MPDQIHIEALEIHTRIGVPDEERATPQRLTVTLTLEPERDFRHLGDQLAGAVDYAAVCATVEAVAAERPRQLVETLAEEIANAVLQRFALRKVVVEARKFILPQTAFVAVKVERQR